jgi:signal recognition particle-docking protein ftsY
MGFFDKIKQKFKKEEVKNEKAVEEKKEVYDKGLSKSRKQVTSLLSDLTHRYTKINEEYFNELEEILIMADIGVNTVMKFVDRLKARVNHDKITDPEELKEMIVDELFIIYVDGEVLTTKLETIEEGPTVYLFVGVNGVGKTTTIAKLANRFVKDGKKVLLVAGDTFRAGAYQQLKEWSERTGAYFYGREGATDPSSVIYEGCELALKENYDYVFIDTAGRLQNKANLMKELEKMNRVINKLIPNSPTETLLVLDASTGQNGIKQAISFKEITNITGIVLTKMDGTAKGGIVLAIKEEVGVPVKFIGFGERAEDLQEFDIEQYIYGLFKDFMEEK